MFSAISEPSETEIETDPIKDVGLSTFMADVIEASKQRLVIVDFWAPWCEPCKQLGPVLENLVRSTKGAVHLAKIDIDKNPQIAQQLGVQSIPAVFAFFRGQPVDAFMGALPETQIKTWLDRLIKASGVSAPTAPAVDEALKQAAELLGGGNAQAAQMIYEDVLHTDPANVAALSGLFRCLIASGEAPQAKDMFAKLPPELANNKIFDPVRASLELAEQATHSGAVADLQTKIEENPTDHQARFDLALAYYAAGEREAAVEQLLEIVRRARGWNEDAARKQLVKLFEAFGAMDPLTVSARKRLSSILFA